MSIRGAKRVLFFVCHIFLAVTLLATLLVYAQSENFLLEAEQHWETYGVGGTCIPGTHNLFVADVDGDNFAEIFTGGFMYNVYSNGTVTPREAPLRVWKWDGRNLTLAAKEGWAGGISCVYAADIDRDGRLELFSSGSVWNATGSYSSLSMWRYDDASLTLETSVEGFSTSSIFVSDADADGTREVIAVGTSNSSGRYGAKLYVWRLDGSGLTLECSQEWCVGNATTAASVFAEDLDNDGRVEIVTAGYAYDLKNSSGQLRVWQYDGNALSLKSTMEWRLVEGVYALNVAGGVQGNTCVNNVKVGDVDGDGTPEIITGGFAYDGKNVNAQLRIWSWDGEIISLEKSEEWMTDYITEIKGVCLNDVDADSKLEIVTSGTACAEGNFGENSTIPERAQLRVWSWDGATLSLEQSKDWVVGEGVCAWNVAAGDIDNDGVAEIVTVGCMHESKLCDPDMRIWSLQSTSWSTPWVSVLGVGISVAAVSVSVLFLARKRMKISR